MTKINCLLTVASLGFTWCFSVGATDFPCHEVPLAFQSSNSIVFEPLLDTVGVLAPLNPLIDKVTGSTMGLLPQRLVPLQQVNMSKALQQAYENIPSLTFSQTEKIRQVNSLVCTASYNRLMKIFLENRKKIHFPDDQDDSEGLAKFVSWYINPGTLQSDKDLAMPIVTAQRDYDKDCLVKEIPSEMNPDLLKRAVGILFADTQPICIALRQGANSIITAQHCFRSPDGNLHSYTKGAILGINKIWFAYEAEPSNRYGVCRNSIPKVERQPFRPYADNLRLIIANPHLPAAPWKWAAPLSSGVSLYLRGYFHFSNETADIDRMRATANGGCAVLEAKNRCIFHACQSTQIMSGAPVFVRPEPGQTISHLEVAGIHLGSAALASKTAAISGVCEDGNGRNFDLSNFAYQPKGYE